MLGLILPYKGIMPTIGEGVFIAHNAAVIGNVVLGDHSNIWFSCVVRGDVNEIRIGKNTNIQDGTLVHCSSQEGGGTYIGGDVTVGHMTRIHACTLEDGAFVGIGAKVFDGAYVEIRRYGRGVRAAHVRQAGQEGRTLGRYSGQTHSRCW